MDRRSLTLWWMWVATTCSRAAQMSAPQCSTRLPSARLSIAYATDRTANDPDSVVRACVDHGVNVVVWAFAHLERGGPDGAAPTVRATFDVAAVAEAKRRLAERLDPSRQVAHLVAFGGWNGPHPDTAFDGAEYYAAWTAWNRDGVFDGVDWDLEGRDDPTAPTTVLRESVVDLVVDFSKRARADGYVVGLAPAESYLDALSDGAVSLSLNEQPLSPWPADVLPGGTFPYAGRNAYAEVLRRLGGSDGIDFCSVQFYEGYSRACFETTRRGTPLSEHLVRVARSFADGKSFGVVHEAAVDDDSKKASSFRLVVPPAKLVLGFANGWADGTKFLRGDPGEIVAAFARLRALGLEPRGTMFWVLDEEGAKADDDFFASQLEAAFLREERARATDRLARDW